MSGNNNVTVAIPGEANWDVWWQWNVFADFQLDIVGFLAVLGEGAVLANAQVSALSRLFYLPRLLPAPQALIRTTRPTTLPPVTAKVTGVYSGNVKDHVHHVANILLGEEMPTFTVRCVQVKKRIQSNRPPTRMDTIFRGQPKRAPTRSPQMGPPLIKAKATGPQTWVTLIGFLEAVILLAMSITFGDGMSILATITLAGLSTVVGIINKWNLVLPRKAQGSIPPPGDVVIRYPNGSYLVVRCDEEVARELYFAPEEINYEIQNPLIYRMLSLVGTIMLMLGIVFLANAKLQLQFAWAGGYVIINIAHWIAAALPQRYNWDLSCYEVEEQGVAGGWKNPNFTEALWKAILLTKSIRWVKNGAAAPQTKVWDDWLVDAEEKAKQYASHVGRVEDPLWPGLNPDKGTIWDAPLPEDWDAKKAWNHLNEQFSKENENGTA
ncbi:hypothetical protein AC578_9925 [Pseudocercospora eumusae]|uniref:Uncharacterized protein n=1 Tax=Pseudocercospora eumusae TaxID=321146 RepID=A0A139HB15_9PEZI|nr:hypothetical protein AC578_9925 [Pseudocercospora eumusae]